MVFNQIFNKWVSILMTFVSVIIILIGLLKQMSTKQTIYEDIEEVKYGLAIVFIIQSMIILFISLIIHIYLEDFTHTIYENAIL